MLWWLIPTILIVISLVVSLVIVVRKIPQLRIMDVLSLPEEKFRQVKEFLLQQRFQRVAKERFGFLINFGAKAWKESSRQGRRLMQKVYSIEQHYRKMQKASAPVSSDAETIRKMMEEAEKRDHRKLGKELDLFVFSELIGGGLPLFTPKGTILRDLLDNKVWKLREANGYKRVDIPHMTKKDLYEKSGHWEKFKDELLHVTTREEHQFVLKPMNCPHHIQIFARRPISYREMPVRYANTTKVYRDEQTGELMGLTRVRSITQDDAHIFCRVSQINEEVEKIWDIIEEFYKQLDLDVHARLSTRDPATPEKYIGAPKKWEMAEESLRKIIKTKRGKKDPEESKGEAAFYGPKIDFNATDSLGRKWQVATIQLDMNQPERFDLTCINEKGEKERIVMIHAAIMGSIERLLAILIEHNAGAFPLWLAPVQVAIIPVNDKNEAYVKKTEELLLKKHIRFETDRRNESLNKKIREAELQKIPYLLVVGDKEKKSKTVSVREREKGDRGSKKLEKFLQSLKMHE